MATDVLTEPPGAPPKVLRMPGLTMSAFKLNADGRQEVQVEGTEASIRVPVAALRKVIGDAPAASVITVFEQSMASESLPGPLRAVVNLNVMVGGKRAAVDEVAEPFFLTLPANRSDGSCMFWDEALGEWSSRGLKEVMPSDGSADGPLVCAAYHLTLFAAIWRGFTQAFVCAQLKLLEATAVREIFRGNWYYHPVAVLFWLLLITLGSLLSAACAADYRRMKLGTFNDTFFLVPLNSGPEEEDVPNTATQASTPASVASSADDRKQSKQSGATETSMEEGHHHHHADHPYHHLEHTSSTPERLASVRDGLNHAAANTCRDALDDILSRWFKYFGEVRALLEGIWEGLSQVSSGKTEPGTCLQQLVHRLTQVLITSSVRRQSSASLGISDENVTFLMEDEDLGELLLDAAISTNRDPQTLTESERRMNVWFKMHESVLTHFDTHWHATHWRRFPLAFARLMIVSSPFTSPFLGCRMMSSSLRVLLFATDIFGSFMMATLFYQASGTVVGKRNAGNCLSSDSGIWEQLGRILAIAVGSLLVSSLPVSLLGSLHSRSFKKFEYEGCREWNRQLRMWKFQDRIIWVFGSVYIGFCIFFVCLFLANVAPTEMSTWGMSGAITLFEDSMVIPFSVAILVPFFATVALYAAAWLLKHTRKELLQKTRAELEEGTGNWKRVVLSI